jgi:glucose-6-phosphate 1-epimerase
LVKQDKLINHQSLGAQVLIYQDFFYLSPVVLDFRLPRRGGVTILFPQFADRGELTKHGLVRGIKWEMVSHDLNGLSEHLSYELNINPNNFGDWPHAANLRLDVVAEVKSITFSLTIKNLGDGSFTWTGGLHPYIKIENLLNVKIEGLKGSKVGNKYKPDQNHQLNHFLSFDGQPFESFFLSSSDLVIHEDHKTVHLSSTGFSEWMIWNPGQSGVKDFLDVPKNDWFKFICIEPVIAHHPQLIEGGRQFTGTFMITEAVV